MVIYIKGEPDSGKSIFAEKLACEMSDGAKYYIATMQAQDDEGLRRIEKHRIQRAGKDFITIELPYGMDGAVRFMPDAPDCLALLECISNLAGNEMYDNPERAFDDVPTDTEISKLADEIMGDIRVLSAETRDLLIVGTIYEKDAEYDDMTRAYIRLIDALDERLVSLADRTYDMSGGNVCVY